MLYKRCDEIVYNKFEYDRFFKKYNDCLLIMSAYDALDLYDEIKNDISADTNIKEEKRKSFLIWLREQMWRVQVKNLEYEDIYVIISIGDNQIQWMFCEHKFYIDKVLDIALPAFYSKDIPLFFYCSDDGSLDDSSDDSDKDNCVVVYRLNDAYRSQNNFHSDAEKKYSLTGIALLASYYTNGDKVCQSGIEGFDW